MTAPVPVGVRLAFDPATRSRGPAVLVGGAPRRVLRLSAGGQRALAELRSGPVRSATAGALARRLTDAGLAHPVPPDALAELTVLVPVRDRAAQLGRCLRALRGRYPVVVVDDGSADPDAVAKVCAEHGAELVVRPRCGGPAAARNTGLLHVATPFVALLDSDCVADPAALARLAAHLADPLVAAAAPRVAPLPGPAARRAVARYGAARGSLDLGERPALVAPLTRVGYVPTAALVVRSAALGDGPFDPALRYGEDVDLVWRLVAAGWRVRYDPAVRVHHDEPATWRALVARRFRYGTSAGPLAQRHPAHLVPLVVQPAAAVAVAGLLARRPWLAVAGLAAAAGSAGRARRRAGLPLVGAVPAALAATGRTLLGAGRYGTQVAAPLLAAGLVVRGRRRSAAAALLLAGPLTAWATARPRLDPVRFTAAAIADDVAYGCGVWAGCLTRRTALPLRPRLARRPPIRPTRRSGP